MIVKAQGRSSFVLRIVIDGESVDVHPSAKDVHEITGIKITNAADSPPRAVNRDNRKDVLRFVGACLYQGVPMVVCREIDSPQTVIRMEVHKFNHKYEIIK